jgi:N-methylhydantoinase A
MERTARTELKDDVGTDAVRFVRSADMRYLGQFHTITVMLPSDLAGLADLSLLGDRFHSAHEAVYGHSAPGEPTELISLRLAAFVPVKKPALPVIAVGDVPPPSAARLGERQVLWEDGVTTATPFFAREDLLAGNTIQGPAIIQEAASVIPIALGESARVDRLGNVEIEIGGQ